MKKIITIVLSVMLLVGCIKLKYRYIHTITKIRNIINPIVFLPSSKLNSSKLLSRSSFGSGSSNGRSRWRHEVFRRHVAQAKRIFY